MSGRPNQANRGDHSARGYAAILYGLARGRRSGVLEVRSGDQWRRLRVLAGRPVTFESSVEEDSLQTALAAAGAVPERQLTWIVSKLEDGENLSDALLNSGALDEQGLRVHRSGVLDRGVGAAFAWPDGAWSFAPADHIDPDRIDPALLPEATLAAGLWRGVVAHLVTGALLDEVTDADAGEVGLRPALLEDLDAFDLGSPLDELPGVIGTGTTVEALLKTIEDPSGNVVKLLWLLEIAGLISRKGRVRQEDSALVSALATRIEEPPSQAPAPAPAPPTAVPEDVDPGPDGAPSGRMRAAALRAGHALAYAPGAAVEHSHPPTLRGTFARHRVAHRQAASEFGLRTVPSLPAAAMALALGLPGDLRDGGATWAIRGLPRRASALLGQWLGGREGSR